MKNITHNFVIKLMVITSVFLSNSAIAQDSKPDSSKVKMYNNSLIASGGLGFIYGSATLYYERMFQGNFLGPKISTFIVAGIGVNSYWEGGGSFFLLRYGILTGKKKHHLESSAGAVYYYTGWVRMSPSISIGYRFQKPRSHFIFRTGVGWPEAVYVSCGVSF